MSVPSERSRIVLELPRDPLLRALAIYCVIGLVVIMVAPVVVPLLGMPAWLSGFVVMCVILAAPLVAAGAWLVDRRR